MKYTNKLNLPESIVKSCVDHEKPLLNRYSVTELLKSPQEIVLTRKHWENIEIDVSECINTLFGSAVHKVLEDNTDNPDIEKEVKMEYQFGKYIIVGKFDRRNLKEQLIEDYKTCTVSKISKKDFDNDYKQGMMYALFTYKTTGVIIRKLKFYNLMKDWGKIKCASISSYPSNPIYVWEYDIKDSDYDFIINYIKEKFNDIENFRKCTDEERWYTGTKYAVYKKVGDKKAIKICDTEIEAHEAITELCDGVGEIQVRKGEYLKCKYYCNVCKFCKQYKEEVE